MKMSTVAFVSVMMILCQSANDTQTTVPPKVNATITVTVFPNIDVTTTALPNIDAIITALPHIDAITTALPKAIATCVTSPVNLPVGIFELRESLDFDCFTSVVHGKVINEYELPFVYETTGTFQFANSTYDFSDFYITVNSSHKINHKRSRAEISFIGSDTNEEVAVVSVLCDQVPVNASLPSGGFWHKFSRLQKNEGNIDIDFNQFWSKLEQNKYYSYNGTLEVGLGSPQFSPGCMPATRIVLSGCLISEEFVDTMLKKSLVNINSDTIYDLKNRTVEGIATSNNDSASMILMYIVLGAFIFVTLVCILMNYYCGTSSITDSPEN